MYKVHHLQFNLSFILKTLRVKVYQCAETKNIDSLLGIGYASVLVG